MMVWLRVSPGDKLIQNLDPVVFDHRIAENIPRNGVEVFAGQHRDFEILSLADVLDALMAEAVERRANGLALRVEN